MKNQENLNMKVKMLNHNSIKLAISVSMLSLSFTAVAEQPSLLNRLRLWRTICRPPQDHAQILLTTLISL